MSGSDPALPATADGRTHETARCTRERKVNIVAVRKPCTILSSGPHLRIVLPHDSGGVPYSPQCDDQLSDWIADRYRDTL